MRHIPAARYETPMPEEVGSEGAPPPPMRSGDPAAALTRGSVLGLVVLVAVLVVGQRFLLSSKKELTKALKPWEEAEQKRQVAQAQADAQKKPPLILMPEPIGPANAPVRIVVFLNPGNSCHSRTSSSVTALAGNYQNKVRLEFRSTAEMGGKQAADHAGISCEAGMTINGKSSVTYKVGGQEKTISLVGPVGEHGYSAQDLTQAVDYLIQHPGQGSGAAPAQPAEPAKKGT